MSVARLCLLGAALAVLAPLASACPVAPVACPIVLGQMQACALGDGAPTNFAATYDSATNTLKLTWSAPTHGTPSSYNVYRDDALLGTVTDLSKLEYADDLGTVTGLDYYYATAVTSGAEGPQSPTLWLVKGGSGGPVPCDPLVVGIYTTYPFVETGIRDECLP